VSTNGQPQPLLRLSGVNTYYGQMHILQDVNLEVGEGELVCLLGGNASGKSTTLKTILGIVPLRTGSVVLRGEDVTGLPTAHRIVRGIAIVLMGIYHLAFDLAYFGGYEIDVWSGGWKLLARTSVTLFLLLVGACFAISYDRTLHTLSTPQPFPRKGLGRSRKAWTIYPKYLKRGLAIFVCGMAISAATWAVAGDAYVKFGILHLIGVSTLLLPFFFKCKILNVPLGVLILSIPSLLSLPSIPSKLFFPLGLPYPGFQSLDYFPLIPWFGVILLGLSIGQILYIKHTQWRNDLPLTAHRSPLLRLLGRHSLLLYLLHQPILIIVLFSLGIITRN